MQGRRSLETWRLFFFAPCRNCLSACLALCLSFCFVAFFLQSIAAVFLSCTSFCSLVLHRLFCSCFICFVLLALGGMQPQHCQTLQKYTLKPHIAPSSSPKNFPPQHHGEFVLALGVYLQESSPSLQSPTVRFHDIASSNPRTAQSATTDSSRPCLLLALISSLASSCAGTAAVGLRKNVVQRFHFWKVLCLLQTV